MMNLERHIKKKLTNVKFSDSIATAVTVLKERLKEQNEKDPTVFAHNVILEEKELPASTTCTYFSVNAGEEAPQLDRFNPLLSFEMKYY